MSVAAPATTRAPMTRLERYVNVAAVLVPFLGFLVAAVALWSRAVGPSDMAILAGTYLLTGVGVTVGYHRLLTHRSFATHPWVAYLLAVLGSMAVQGPVIDWVADHRKHHAHTDTDGDPHSPTSSATAPGCAVSGTRTSAGCSACRARRPSAVMHPTCSRTAACA